MIVWFSVAQIVLACTAGLFAVIAGLAGRKPNDVILGGAVLVELLLVVQVVLAIVAPFVGNVPSGDLLEFWVYLVSAVLVPVAGGVWALIDRSRWSTVVVGVALLAIAVMVYRMNQIWFVQTV